VKAAVIRGVSSEGMLCSEKDLGLSDDHAGILVLPVDAPLGADLATYLGLDDWILEIEITPNRPDALSIVGVAREISALTGAPLVDIVKAMALPNAMEVWPTLAHPIANKVGWFDLNNINCGLLGMPLGFLIMWIVSRMGPAPSPEMQAMVDEIRKPRGRTVLEEH